MDLNSIIALDGDALFDFANDTDQSILCDWREEPDAVVDYANAFLPEDLALEYTENDDGLTICNRNGRYSVSIDDYEETEEPIPMLLREINKLIAPSHAARYFNCLDGTDSYSYLLRSNDFWTMIDSQHPGDATRIFRDP
tara:strand:- start:20833 stop:21252 length:420 start_codon:yes stop_codon:yes gene_type:complete